jgi:hypothetical protein
MMPLRIFIGWDSREVAAFHVLSHSIITRARRPVAITPLVRNQLDVVYARPRGETESTEFSLTRFLVPYLTGYEGWSVFMDCDMLCLADMTDLMLNMSFESDKAVVCCQHQYTPSTVTKMDGQIQTVYPRKNWSSLMLFNGPRCKALTPVYVNGATGLELHRFAWLRDEEIGSLPLEWNWLQGEYPDNPNARILHYTLGGPWFEGYRDCPGADKWYTEAEAAGVRIGATV